jgi:hypothetical protein
MNCDTKMFSDIEDTCDPELFIGDDSDADNSSIDCRLVKVTLDKPGRRNSHLLRNNDAKFHEEIPPNNKKSLPNFGGV